MSFEKYGWAIEKSLFPQTNQGSTFSQTRDNSKMFNITLKYLDFLTVNHLQAPPEFSCMLFLFVLQFHYIYNKDIYSGNLTDKITHYIPTLIIIYEKS